MSDARFERLTGIAGLALALLASGCGGRESGSEATASPPAGAPASATAAPGAGGASLVEPEEAKFPPASGRTFYVQPKESDDVPTDDDATGTPDRPFRELRQALNNLAPGDRLVLLAGRYHGPFVVDDSADGTAERPIEVIARMSAVLYSRAESPVLTVKKAYWTFHNLEIEGGENAAFAFSTEGEGAHHVVLHDAHLHDGRHSGVLVGPGSSNVTISDSHIHIFGSVERGKAVDPNAAPSAFGIVIAPGTRGVRIERNRVHNIFGQALQTFAPNDYTFGPAGEQWPPAEPVTTVDNQFQDNWKAGEPR